MAVAGSRDRDERGRYGKFIARVSVDAFKHCERVRPLCTLRAVTSSSSVGGGRGHLRMSRDLETYLGRGML